MLPTKTGLPYLALLALLICSACQAPNSSEEETDISGDTISHDKQLTYHFNLQEQRQSFFLQYVQDSIFFAKQNQWEVKYRDIQVRPTNQAKSLSDQMVEELKQAFTCGIRHNISNFKEVLNQVDLNFDGHKDLYFVGKDCFAQNTNYQVYIFQAQTNSYELSPELSAMAWSRLFVNPPRKRFDVYQQTSAGESTVNSYRIASDGQLIPVVRVE